MFPYFPSPGSLSHSSYKYLKSCELRFALSNCVSHQGLKAVSDHNPLVQKTMLLGKVTGSWGWTGGLNHELLEGLLFSAINRHHGWNAPADEELVAEHWKRFEHEWAISRRFDRTSFL